VSTWAPILSGLMTGGVAATIVGYIRDRRFTNAKGAVAEGTVSIRIDEDRLSLLRQSQDAERDVWSATTGHLRAQLAQERLESAEKDRQIQELTRLVAELRSETDALETKVASVESKLKQLAPPPEDV
jgi:chromosome segregation ATPase